MYSAENASPEIESKAVIPIKKKALQLNLDPKMYGTIAEIGGGQEVAGNFFRAGAASGTIAKTMSAYDMTFSDAIYGKCERHVSEEKLLKMLEREFDVLSTRLVKRAKKSQFFAYANTVEVINYNLSNEGHGWMGIRFQKHVNTEPNDCIIHFALKDRDTISQQEVLGDVGVNLIHSCFYLNSAEDIMNSLSDNVRKHRIEIDMFRVTGPDFRHVDNRLMTLKLVKNGWTKIAMFGPDKRVVIPKDKIYKRNTLILRGRFRPVTHVNVDMMLSGMRSFRKFLNTNDVFSIVEINLKDLLIDSNELDELDYLDRVNLLCSLGQYVMITNYQEHYKLAGYLSQFIKEKKLGMIIGVNNLTSIFDENYYTKLSGGILESFARLFGSNAQLLVYPALDTNGKLTSSEDFKPAPHLQSLYQFFKDNKSILDIEGVKTENLNIISDDVLKMIDNNEEGWEKKVPNRVAESIKKNRLFNYHPIELSPDSENNLTEGDF